NTSASQNIKISNNYVQNCGATVGHPNILVSGLASAAGPIRDVAFANNVSVDAKNGAYKAEGSFENVTNTDMVTQKGAVATVLPTQADIKPEDPTVLRTRDVSHVPAEVRSGLYRIHVRKAPTGGFEQRFEYLVKGAPEIVSTYVKVRTDADDYLSEQRT